MNLSTSRLTYVNTLSDHEGRVTVIATSSTLGDIATVCSLKTSKHSSSEAQLTCNQLESSVFSLDPFSIAASIAIFL